MANNTSSSCNSCNSDLGLPIGLTGAAGAPSILALSYTIGGSPFAAATTTYEEAGRFIFSNTAADPFTALRTNVWVSAGEGSMRVIDLITSTVVYENTSITSTSATNVEVVTGQSIYNVSSAILAVQVKHNTAAGATINIATSTFSYS